MGRHAGPSPEEGDPSAGSRDAVRLDARVFGTVQGVGFRYWTRGQAEELGLCGHAKNLDDGSVAVVAEGPRQRVEELLEWLKSGRTPGRVERVDSSMSAAGGNLRGFGVG